MKFELFSPPQQDAHGNWVGRPADAVLKNDAGVVAKGAVAVFLAELATQVAAVHDVLIPPGAGPVLPPAPEPEPGETHLIVVGTDAERKELEATAAPGTFVVAAAGMMTGVSFDSMTLAPGWRKHVSKADASRWLTECVLPRLR